MSAFDLLLAELDRWQAAQRVATFWWRDDDAAKATPALTRLLDLRAQLGVPLAIAAIPAPAEPSLADALRGQPAVAVLQHGWAHRNHAADGRPKIELGGGRAAWDLAMELVRGREKLIALTGGALLPVMVPPWNRIDPALVPLLPGLGYAALSGWGARPAAEAAPGLAAINVHIDVIDWPGTRRFVGEAEAVGQAVAHLAARRQASADPHEPTGLMTHHLAHDEESWAFAERFVAATAGHPAARWLPADAVFPPVTAAVSAP